MSFYILGKKYNINSESLHKNKRPTKIPNEPPKIYLPHGHYDCSRNPPESYRCYYCNYSTKFLVQFNRHIYETKTKPSADSPDFDVLYTCEKCDIETSSQLILLKHAYETCLTAETAILGNFAPSKAQGSGPKTVKLLYCDKSDIRDSPDPRGSSEVLACESCPYRTTRRYFLNRHTLCAHDGHQKSVKWHKCDQCDYKSTNSSTVKKHRRFHKPDAHRTWHECDRCAFRTTLRGALCYHKNKVHGGERAEWHECDKCPYKTKNGHHFRRHVTEQHSEDFKWLECDKCPYRARQKIHMKLHTVQRHTPDDQIEWFECEQCPYRAKIKASLKNHVLKRHALAERLVCEKCGCEVGQRELRRHLREKHGCVPTK